MRHLTLVTQGLLSKWGFADGDMPGELFDHLDDHDLPHCLDRWHDVLVALVRNHVVPVLDQVVATEVIGTNHNPIRASYVNGDEVPHEVIVGAAESPWKLTPEVVRIPIDIVVAAIFPAHFVVAEVAYDAAAGRRVVGPFATEESARRWCESQPVRRESDNELADRLFTFRYTPAALEDPALWEGWRP